MSSAVTSAIGSGLMPWSAIAVLTPTLVAAGLLLMWIGRKASTGTLQRNWVAGIRTTTTLASDEAWMAAHVAGGPAMTWAGVASVLAGLALLVRPSDAVGLVIVLAGTGVMLALVVVSAVKGQRAARAIGDE